LPEIYPVKFSLLNELKEYPDRTSYLIDEKSYVKFPSYKGQNSSDLILDDGLPDTRLAPIDSLITEFRSLSKLKAFKKYLGYRGPFGASYLINILVPYLCSTRGLKISNENILITNGAHMGIYLSAKILLKPGDNIIVGEPGYKNANLTFQQMGAKINKIPVDD